MHESSFISGVHHCFIIDDVGIATTFPKIKSKLANQETHHVSVLYISQSNQFIFKKELDLLEKLFALQCIVFYENTIETNAIQAALETILNINVMSEMNFIVSGTKLFSNNIENQLHFLGVKQIQIQEQYFV
jgi:ferredoxin-NADP reductase